MRDPPRRRRAAPLRRTLRRARRDGTKPSEIAKGQSLCPKGRAGGRWQSRIKEQPLELFADRTSARTWWSNQLRVFLSAAAYLLREAIRRLDLADTELARAQVGTIHLKLLKLGAIIVRNTRRVCLPFSTACPLQELFVKVAHRLSAPARRCPRRPILAGVRAPFAHSLRKPPPLRRSRSQTTTNRRISRDPNARDPSGLARQHLVAVGDAGAFPPRDFLRGKTQANEGGGGCGR